MELCNIFENLASNQHLTLVEWCSLAFVVFMIITIACIRKRLISSEKDFLHALGLSLEWADLILFAIFLVGIYVAQKNGVGGKMYYPTIVFSYLLYVLWMFRRFVKALKMDNRRKDTCNHMLQTTMLLCGFVFLIYIIFYFNINENNFLPFGLCATILGLIFNDSIKGIVAYYHLRNNHLLHIGDWIEVHNQHIDGVIVDISLVTVTVRNWDNTLSNVSIISLQNGSFKNNQDVLAGKTSGRRMFRSFVIDTRSIKSLNCEEIEIIKQKMKSFGEDDVVFAHFEQGTYTSLNIHLFRMYLRHWLMNNPEITRYPRMVVRLLEPTSEGLPLQVYTYILKTSVMPYELVQSSVVEHILLSMEWFGLRLYQKPSGVDVTHLCDN